MPASNVDMPRLPRIFRWLVIVAILASIGLRVASRHWDPSVFLQIVFSFVGLAFTARGKTAGTERPDPIARGILGLAVIVVCMVIATAAWLTVPAMAPLAVAVIALVWAYMLRRFRLVVFVVPLLLLVPIGLWEVHALRYGSERERFLHATAPDFARVEITSPDGTRHETLATEAQRTALASLLAQSAPLYPNHESVADAWRLHIVLRDGHERDLLLGHGSRSRSFAWLAFDDANDFAIPVRLEDALGMILPSSTPGATDAATPVDPAWRSVCERTVAIVCAAAAACNPGGRIHLFIPGDSLQGSVSFFDRAEECAPSYVQRRCNVGGYRCVESTPPRCIDLDPVVWNASRAVAVPASCADVFREHR